MAWGILGALKRICLAICRHDASMSAHTLAHDRGMIMRQIWGRSLTAVTLQIRMRICRLSPHLSSGPVGGFKVADGATRNGRLSMYFICGCMGVGGEGGTRALGVSWWACRVASARYMLVRALLVLEGALVRPRIHPKKGYTC